MLAYISLAVFVVIVWMFFPTFSLIAFLGISLLHFGYGDAKNGEGITKFAEAVAHGGLVIVGISQFHRGEVDEIFYYLIKQDTSTIWLTMNIASIGVIAAIATCLLPDLQRRQVVIDNSRTSVSRSRNCHCPHYLASRYIFV